VVQSFVRMLRHSPSTLVRHTAGLGLHAGSAAEVDDSAHANGNLSLPASPPLFALSTKGHECIPLKMVVSAEALGLFAFSFVLCHFAFLEGVRWLI
jgi:hypothetical protein